MWNVDRVVKIRTGRSGRPAKQRLLVELNPVTARRIPCNARRRRPASFGASTWNRAARRASPAVDPTRAVATGQHEASPSIDNQHRDLESSRLASSVICSAPAATSRGSESWSTPPLPSSRSRRARSS